MDEFESQKIDFLSEAAQSLELPKVLDIVAQFAHSPAAVERIRQLPILDEVQAIRAELDRVSDMRALLDRGEDLPLEEIADLAKLFDHLKVAGVVLTPAQLVELARVAKVAREVRRLCQEQKAQMPAVMPLAEGLQPLREFEAAVTGAIDFNTHEILDSASPALRRIRRDMEAAQEAVREKLQQILKKAAGAGMLQEQLITVRDGRLVLMVKDEHKRKIGGIVHDQSATGQTLFIEPMETVEMNNRVRQLQAQERREIERILAELSNQAHEHHEALERNYHILIELETLRARAVYSRQVEGNAAQVNAGGRIVLYAARHPLLLEKYQDHDRVVPLNVQLGDKFHTLVITGPNAGGKTVAMKTVGLAVLMTRAGLHIPASPDSEIGIMGRVFVDIGDQQSIENDLSTFSSHMTKLKRILETAEQNDLVLIDEIGSGTDPEEGTALAISALKTLNDRGVRTIVTTHHGALKVFAHNTPGVENGSMVFDAESLQPTYEFRPGVPGASYAFEIAGRIGLDERVIAEARQYVGREKGELERLIADLERKIQEQDEKIRQLKLEETRLNGLIKLYQERAEELATRRRKLKQQAIEESETILARANAAVEQAIREIREKQAAKEAIRASKARLERERERLQREKRKMRAEARAREEEIEVETVVEAIAPGSVVLWRSQNSEAVVLEPPDGENRVLLQAGPLKLRVPLDDIKPLQKKPKSRARVTVEKPAPVPQETDVRGMRVDEALVSVDQYLSEALLYGWDEVRIIHGKGTGALRKAINEFLRQHPNVSHFEPAPLGKGDIGVTVVKLK
ncbi:MAG: endonuclease MutS2 [candidate division KSB1 bacterium]|nr:endonuclease MutS2 [candidate division KSB1 bacterium]